MPPCRHDGRAFAASQWEVFSRRRRLARKWQTQLLGRRLMSTLMQRAGIGALVLFGLLAGQDVARAQFSFGMTRFGMNPNNPFVAQQQYLANLQPARLAIASVPVAPASY